MTPPPRLPWPRLVDLAGRNLLRGWTRSLLPMTMLGLVLALAFVIGPASFATHLRQEASRSDHGANVVIARSESGIDRSTCERLRGNPAIAESGSSRFIATREIRPGLRVPSGGITLGMLRLLTQADTVRAAPGQPILGAELADRLHVSPATGHVVLPRSGPRTENVDGWTLEVEPPVSVADDCWVEMMAWAYPAGVDIVTAALLPTSPDVVVTALMFDGGPRAFPASRVDLAVGTAALAAALVTLVGLRLHRGDLALYRTLGFRRIDAALAVLIEVLAVTGSTLALVLAAWTVGEGDPLPRSAILSAWAVLAAALASTIVVATLGLAIVGRDRRIVAIIREGS
ncbi:MAG: hypothetical protein D6683_08475 [Actinomyces sp.]|nr:MAG: hypothetical protein D6683_08475 [Actinomyces sp.]